MPADATSIRGGLAAGFPAGRAALVVYLMAGYPNRATSLASLRAAAHAGADVIELGVPYGDPLADGPVIAGAGHSARLQPGGFGLAEALDLCAEFTRTTPGAPPIAIMTYVNPILRLGFEPTARKAREAGAAGFIVPDLPPDNPMARRWIQAAHTAGLDTVFLVAPTSTPDRVSAAAGASTGFIYVVSSIGITGERAKIRDDLGDLVARVRAARDQGADVPVAIGFGVSSPEQAAQVAGLADGVVVGSAVVRRQTAPQAVAEFVGELAEAVRGAR